MHYWFALALAALLAAPAQADVYKCRDADGKLSFTDRPCPKGAQSETVEIVDPASDAAVASIEPGCVDLAQAVWRLQPMEAGGRLSADQRSELSGARNRLEQECGMQLASSSLAFRCQVRQAAVTAATARAADPAHAGDLAMAEADYKQQCDDGAVNADIRQHLRPTGGAR